MVSETSLHRQSCHSEGGARRISPGQTAADSSIAPDSATENRAHGEKYSPYATPSATREVLERHGLYTKYALGQNFLVNDDVIRRIIELADVRPTDRILEVGPGIGTLTAALLPRTAHVTSVEMDRDLPMVLSDTLAPWSDKFTLITDDALNLTKSSRTPFAQLSDEPPVSSRSADPASDASAKPLFERIPNKLVSNLPYAVAATVVLDYLQNFDFLESATVMVQKEVADRMTASPGSKVYGAYTVKLGLYAKSAGRFSVAPGNFFPPPRVESSVLRLDRAPARDDAGNELTPEQLRAACTMADAAFTNRRKTIANSCKTYFANDPHTQACLPELFEQAGIDPRRRGESLDQQEFVRLALAYCSATQSEAR